MITESEAKFQMAPSAFRPPSSYGGLFVTPLGSLVCRVPLQASHMDKAMYLPASLPRAINYLMEPQGSRGRRNRPITEVAKDSAVFFDVGNYNTAHKISSHRNNFHMALLRTPEQFLKPKRPVEEPSEEEWANLLVRAIRQQRDLHWYKKACREIQLIQQGQLHKSEAQTHQLRHMNRRYMDHYFHAWMEDAETIANNWGETKEGDTGYGFGVSFYHPGLNCFQAQSAQAPFGEWPF